MAKQITYREFIDNLMQMPGPLGLQGTILNLQDNYYRPKRSQNPKPPGFKEWENNYGGYMNHANKDWETLRTWMEKTREAQNQALQQQVNQNVLSANSTAPTTPVQTQTSPTVTAPDASVQVNSTPPPTTPVPVVAPSGNYVMGGAHPRYVSGDNPVTTETQAMDETLQSNNNIRQQGRIQQALRQDADPTYQGEVPILMYPNAYAGTTGMTLQSVMEEASNEIFNLTKGKTGKAGQDASASVTIPYSTQPEMDRTKIEIDRQQQAYVDYMKAYNEAVKANNEAYRRAREGEATYLSATNPLSVGSTDERYTTGLYVMNPDTGLPMFRAGISSYRPLNPPSTKDYNLPVTPPTVQQYQAQSASGISRPPQHNTPPQSKYILSITTTDATGNQKKEDFQDSTGQNGTLIPEAAMRGYIPDAGPYNLNIATTNNEALLNGLYDYKIPTQANVAPGSYSDPSKPNLSKQGPLQYIRYDAFNNYWDTLNQAYNDVYKANPGITDTQMGVALGNTPMGKWMVKNGIFNTPRELYAAFKSVNTSLALTPKGTQYVASWQMDPTTKNYADPRKYIRNSEGYLIVNPDYYNVSPIPASNAHNRSRYDADTTGADPFLTGFMRYFKTINPDLYSNLRPQGKMSKNQYETILDKVISGGTFLSLKQ